MGNRRDAIAVKKLDAMHSLMPHIKPNRCDSDVYINQNVDMTAVVGYLEKLRKNKKYEHITYFHIFCMTLGKVFYNRPLLNRFIMNKRYYDRVNVTLGYVAKREFSDDSEETMQMINVKENDNIFTISDVIANTVKKVRTNESHGVDKLMDFVGSLPKPIKGFLVGIIKFADHHDLLPTAITKDLLYYSSAIVSNLGSIGCGSIYHNLTDFGTNSFLITMGPIRDENVVVNGKTEVRKMCSFGVNVDERIADGFYFAKSIQLFDYIMQNPQLLEDNANTVVALPERKKKK